MMEERLNICDRDMNRILSRLSEGMSKLSRECGVPPTVLYHFIQRGNMRLVNLKQLADYLGVTTDVVMNTVLPLMRETYGRSASNNVEDQRDAARQEYLRLLAIGDLGEDYVLELERERLAGTPYEKQVTGEYAFGKNSAFDILSYVAETGEPILIEVKSTIRGPKQRFSLSERELRCMNDCMARGVRYELHRVYYVNDPKRRGRKIYTAKQLKERFDITPSQYNLSWKHGKKG